MSYEIIKLIAIAYLFYSMDSIFDVVKVNKLNLLKYFKTIVYCDKCLAFWIALLYGWNLYEALIISLCVLFMQSFIITRLK